MRVSMLKLKENNSHNPIRVKTARYKLTALFADKQEYILSGSTTEKSYPGMRCWLKRGKSETEAGYTWSTFTNFVITSPAINSHTYSTRKIALAGEIF